MGKRSPSILSFAPGIFSKTCPLSTQSRIGVLPYGSGSLDLLDSGDSAPQNHFAIAVPMEEVEP